MNLEEKLPNLRRQLAEQPIRMRFRLGDVCHDEWVELAPGEQSQLGRRFRQKVLDGHYQNIISIGRNPFKGGSEEYIRLEH